MSRDLENEVKALRRNLQTGFEKVKPTEQFKATMILAVVQLHVLIGLIKNSLNPEERRELFNEFRRQKESIEKGIQMLSQQTQRFGTIHASPQN